MKQLRPVSLALAVLALCSWTAASSACDQNKSKNTATASSSCSSTKASAVTADYTAKNAAQGHTCTAEMAAQCTRDMAASCTAMKGASAKTAGHTKASAGGCCAAKGAKASAVTAEASGGETGNGAVLAGAEGCAAHSAKTTAMAGGSCASKGAKTTAMAAGAGGSCSAHGTKASGHMAHGNCDGCADFNDCDQALRDMGAALQVVPLKNGVMYVYTTDPAKVRAVQATMAQRRDQMAMFAAAGSGKELCNDCKQLRGAAMSGKLSREVVNIEGGCLTLMTSNDPAVVARIHAHAGVLATRAKI